MTSKELILILNTLSNHSDWDSDNIEKDLENFIYENTSLEKQLVRKIVIKFLSLPALLRESPNFDVKSFILDIKD